MEKARNYSQKIFFLIGERFGILIMLVIATIIFFTNTAIKAYSESDVKYRQESMFNDTGLTANNGKNIPDINPAPIGATEDAERAPVIGMSFEVDKITPTPTPAINPSEDSVWLKLADCESHQNWRDDTGNGYYGGLQFSLGAWASVGGSGKPSDASAAEQILRGKLLQSVRGWGAWGGCSRKLGYR